MKKFTHQAIVEFSKIYNFAKKSSWISIILVFSFFVIFALITYMNVDVVSSSDDHYFHFRFAEQMHQNGFLNSFRDFKSIYFTKIAQGDYFIYYNFLYYLVVLPFSFITPLFMGIKLYAVFIIGLIGAFMYWSLKKLDTSYAFLWTFSFFALIGVSPLWRLFLSRPYVLAPTLIILLVVALYKKSYFWIFALSFLYLFWHSATFFFPLLVVAAYFISYNLYTRLYEWKSLAWVSFGVLGAIVLAYVLGTGFLSYLYDLFSVFQNSVFGQSVKIPEGMELYPNNFFDFISQNIFLFTLYISAIIMHVTVFFHEKKNIMELESFLVSKRVLMMTLFFISSVAFAAISSVSQRFSDFFIFFGWVFIVLVFSEVFSYTNISKNAIKKGLIISVVVCVFYLFANNSIQLREHFAGGGNMPEDFAEIGGYLNNNLSKGDIVFDPNWGWFPQLYYYAPKQNYVIGLEPKLTYEYNNRLYFLWSHIGEGYVCEVEKCPDQISSLQKIRDKKFAFKWFTEQGDLLSKVMIDDFNSHYIVSSKDYSNLNNILNNNKHFKLVLNDKNKYFIYKVIN